MVRQSTIEACSILMDMPLEVKVTPYQSNQAMLRTLAVPEMILNGNCYSYFEWRHWMSELQQYSCKPHNSTWCALVTQDFRNQGWLKEEMGRGVTSSNNFVTQYLDVSLCKTESSAWPCCLKILTLAFSRSFRSIPSRRGMAPTQDGHIYILECCHDVCCWDNFCNMVVREGE